jgi:hypothetical protein
MRYLIAILVLCSSAFAMTDLRVNSVTVSEGSTRYIVAVEIYAADDSAENVTLTILVPAGSSVTAVDTEANCKILRGGNAGADTAVQCNLGHINVEETKTIGVDVSKDGNSTFGAFVFSNFGDNNPADNFLSGSL